MGEKPQAGKRLFIVDEKSLPDLPGMMLATLNALRALGGSGTLQEIDNKVIELEGVPEEEQAYEMPNNEGRRRINYYLSWARTYLKRGGAIENSARGVWSLLPKGERITSIEETKEIYNQVNAEERERRRQKRQEQQARQSNVPEETETAAELTEEPDDDWKSTLLDILRNMAPSDFERLVQRLLREAGFVQVRVLGKSHDGGIDGIGILRINLVTFHVYFQCKRWNASNAIGAKHIRDFRGALQGRADKGLFVTTSTFTKDAQQEATRDGAIAIDLIDGEQLCELLKQYGLGVTTERIEKVTVDRNWFEQRGF